MSVSKYIEEFNASVQESIQKNITRAEENPYPSEEIKKIRESDPESALARMFDENGQLINPLGNQELLFAAIDQNKDLYDRLRKGHRAKERLKNNERLEALNAEEYLNNIYFKFKQELSKALSFGTEIDVNELLNPANIDDFEEVADIGFGIDTSYADIETIQSAFKEKNDSQTEETAEEPEGEESQAINNEEIVEKIKEEESEDLISPEQPADTGETIETEVEPTQALNLPEEETPEPVEEKPEAAEETQEPVEEKTEAAEETQEPAATSPSPINEEIATPPDQEEILDTETLGLGVETLEETRVVTEEETPPVLNLEESEASTEEEKPPILEDIKNDLENIASGETPPSVSNVFNSISEAIGGTLSENVTNTLGGPINNLVDQASSTLSTQETLGGDVVSNLSNTVFNQDLSNIGEKLNISNLGDNISSSVDKSSTFSSFPKSEVVKPEPVTKEDINNVGESISSTVSSNVAAAASSTSPTSETSDKKETSTQSSPMSQPKQVQNQTGQTGSSMASGDSSGMMMENNRRLKNIEALLMGPLEVKIKN